MVLVKEGYDSAAFKGPAVQKWDGRSHWTNQPESGVFTHMWNFARTEATIICQCIFQALQAAALNPALWSVLLAGSVRASDCWHPGQFPGRWLSITVPWASEAKSSASLAYGGATAASYRGLITLLFPVCDEPSKTEYSCLPWMFIFRPF